VGSHVNYSVQGIDQSLIFYYAEETLSTIS